MVSNALAGDGIFCCVLSAAMSLDVVDGYGAGGRPVTRSRQQGAGQPLAASASARFALGVRDATSAAEE